MWFDEIAAVREPGIQELHGFLEGMLRFFAFALREDAFSFLWEDDRELRGLARDTFELDVIPAVRHLHEELEKAAPTPEGNRRLLDHGLLGRPMRFKLRVLNSIAGQYEKLRQQVAAGVKWFKGQFSMREWFKQLCEAIDAILESISEALGGAGGLIIEFKDALSALVPSACARKQE
jgi:hypothetical protein